MEEQGEVVVPKEAETGEPLIENTKSFVAEQLGYSPEAINWDLLSAKMIKPFLSKSGPTVEFSCKNKSPENTISKIICVSNSKDEEPGYSRFQVIERRKRNDDPNTYQLIYGFFRRSGNVRVDINISNPGSHRGIFVPLTSMNAEKGNPLQEDILRATRDVFERNGLVNVLSSNQSQAETQASPPDIIDRIQPPK